MSTVSPRRTIIDDVFQAVEQSGGDLSWFPPGVRQCGLNPCMGWPAPAGWRGPELSFHLRGGVVAGLIFLSAGRLRAPACYFVRAGCIFQARIVDKNNGTQ